MRITFIEAKSIISQTGKIFGHNALVYLFGSRVDDSKKGGDIDLYIIPGDTDNIQQKRTQLLIALKKEIGDQKIDIVVAQDPSRLIEQHALQEGIELNYLDLRIQKVISECDKHLLRINDAYQDMQSFMPLTADKYLKLTKDEVQDIDQYLYRFSKLQDAIGEKLFKLLLNHFEDNSKPLPFIDILNKLEKIGLISSADEWKALRQLRNDLAHEYEDNPDEVVSLLNLVFSKKPLIENIYTQLKNYVARGYQL